MQITATASDPDNDPLIYFWSTSGGQILGSGSSVRLDTTGLAPGRYTVTGSVADGYGGTADCSVSVDAQAPPEEARKIADRLALHSIYFQTDLPADPAGGVVKSQQQVIRTLAEDFKKYLQIKPDAHLTLEGHADVRGTEQYNKELAGRRVDRTKQLLIADGVAAGSIETHSYGKEEELDAARVKQLIEQNPDLNDEQRRKILSNLPVLVLANNRRVDIVLSTTGDRSIRQYPFNAQDYVALISPVSAVK